MLGLNAGYSHGWPKKIQKKKKKKKGEGGLHMSFTKKKKEKEKKEKKDINICQMSIVKPGPVIMTQSTNIKNRRARKQCLCLLYGFRFFYVGDNRAFETSILN